MLSVLDLFRVGVGPSSSHTVGPMRIAKRFVDDLAAAGRLADVEAACVELRGSLAFTGAGHRTPEAVMLGLMGCDPQALDPDEAAEAVARVRADARLTLPGGRVIGFDPGAAIVFDYDAPLDLHPNAMRLIAKDAAGDVVADEIHFSTGGGFVARRDELEASRAATGDTPPGVDVEAAPLPFSTAAALLAHCCERGSAIHEVVLINEDAMRPRVETEARLDRIVAVMMACIDRGLAQEGVLPGGLAVRRRAPGIWRALQEQPQSNEREQLFDWLNVYAMAVNEENAAGGRVVTAPTNGAAGVLPAVLRQYCGPEPAPAEPRGARRFRFSRRAETIAAPTPPADPMRRARIFLLTAGGVGLLYKQRASISGAEMGCQGEVGVACSMAAAGLAAVWGGAPEQVAAAAEIAMEHNLGLTCDPVGGLVQIPCIERNAVGAVKAVNAARLALHEGATPKVSLDQVIETMRQTGEDMSSKYKETSQGGLAVNVVEC